MAERVTDTNAVEVRSTHYTYPPPREIHAIRGVDLTVRGGEFLCIAGQNGSGKTTLAKLITGFIRPSKGTVRVSGQDPTRMSAKERAALVTYVFQNPDHQLFRGSVWDDVAFSLENIGADEETIEREVERVLRGMELWDKRHLHPFRLAKGDRQRLAVACVTVMRPRVVMVDEPTTGQDPTKAREIMDLLLELNQTEGVTVVVITHSMELIAEYANRVVVMATGKVLLDESPRGVFSQPEKLKEAFLAPPQICRLGLRLGLNPMPLTVDEAKMALLKEIAK